MVLFYRAGKLLNSEDKRKGKKPCNYDLNRIDVEWLVNLNKTRQAKGIVMVSKYCQYYSTVFYFFLLVLC